MNWRFRVDKMMLANGCKRSQDMALLLPVLFIVLLATAKVTLDGVMSMRANLTKARGIIPHKEAEYTEAILSLSSSEKALANGGEIIYGDGCPAGAGEISLDRDKLDQEPGIAESIGQVSLFTGRAGGIAP